MNRIHLKRKKKGNVLKTKYCNALSLKNIYRGTKNVTVAINDLAPKSMKVQANNIRKLRVSSFTSKFQHS